jgi:hypothetical protein
MPIQQCSVCKCANVRSLLFLCACVLWFCSIITSNAFPHMMVSGTTLCTTLIPYRSALIRQGIVHVANSSLCQYMHASHCYKTLSHVSHTPLSTVQHYPLQFCNQQCLGICCLVTSLALASSLAYAVVSGVLVTLPATIDSNPNYTELSPGWAGFAAAAEVLGLLAMAVTAYTDSSIDCAIRYPRYASTHGAEQVKALALRRLSPSPSPKPNR